MSAHLRCVRCDGADFWKIRETRERGAGGDWSMLGSIDQVAPLQALVCVRCGHARFYSAAAIRDKDDPWARQSWAAIHKSHTCRECAGRRQILVPQLREWPAKWQGGRSVPLSVVRGKRGEGVGWFCLRICDDCGLCDWMARGVGSHEAGRSDEHSCPECGIFGRRGVDPLREDGGRPLPVALVDDAPVGQFAVRFCDGCGFSEWFARELDGMRADGERILFISGAREVKTRAFAAGGPYR
jgi:predicted nucleic-acid-binding Zn-ribbon protein